MRVHPEKVYLPAAVSDGIHSCHPGYHTPGKDLWRYPERGVPCPHYGHAVCPETINHIGLFGMYLCHRNKWCDQDSKQKVLQAHI